MYNKPKIIRNLFSFIATSYEGDYQHEMVKFVKKGSLVSISGL